MPNIGKDRLRKIIFEADTFLGKLYDILLILTIAVSVIVVMLDSVSPIHDSYGTLLYCTEWFFTFLFTIDYIIRLKCVDRPSGYAWSFFGVVDLLGIIPTYISLFIPGSHYLVVIRFLRVLRVFRVLKLSTYQDESKRLVRSLVLSHRRIIVFLFSVLAIVVFLGALMYVVEGEENGFTSIPRAIYWAIVTLTTVGYGDISPKTALGQTLAAMIMVLGYSMIVIPTGIIASSVATADRKETDAKACFSCGKQGHDLNATYCKYCGKSLSIDKDI